MFVIYDEFKHVLQFDDGSTNSRVVELLFDAPCFLATVIYVEDEAKIERNFLLASVDDVLAFAEDAPVGELVALQVLHSPRGSSSGEWSFVPARFIDREDEPQKGVRPSAVITASDGTVYRGHPLPGGDEQGELTRVVEFAV